MAKHRGDLIPQHVRDYLYPIVLALLPLLVSWGVMTEEQVPLYAALILAVLGVGTAAAYRPSKTLPDGPGV